MNTIIIAIIGSGALSVLISNLFTLLRENKRQRKVNQILLLGEMERRLETYKRSERITTEQLQIYISVYELYKEEGGNGYADSLLAQCKDLV